jgi:hypothetical protein
LHLFAGDVELTEVDKHQMIVCAAAHDIEAVFDQRFGKRLGVFDDLPLVKLELRL